MGQKNCALSLIKKPCPRGVFDCRRCLTKMKNAGKAWKVWLDTPSVLGGRGQIPAFETKLYWDMDDFVAFMSLPEDVTYADIKCVSGIWGRIWMEDIPQVLTLYPNVPNQLNEGHIQIRVALYFDQKWWLWLRLDNVVFGNAPLGGNDPDVFFSAEAHYSTDEDNCSINDQAVFTKFKTNTTDNATTSSFPETVTFQHVDNDGFND